MSYQPTSVCRSKWFRHSNHTDILEEQGLKIVYLHCFFIIHYKVQTGYNSSCGHICRFEKSMKIIFLRPNQKSCPLIHSNDPSLNQFLMNHKTWNDKNLNLCDKSYVYRFFSLVVYETIMVWGSRRSANVIVLVLFVFYWIHFIFNKCQREYAFHWPWKFWKLRNLSQKSANWGTFSRVKWKVWDISMMDNPPS